MLPGRYLRLDEPLPQQKSETNRADHGYSNRRDGQAKGALKDLYRADGPRNKKMQDVDAKRNFAPPGESGRFRIFNNNHINIAAPTASDGLV